LDRTRKYSTANESTTGITAKGAYMTCKLRSGFASITRTAFLFLAEFYRRFEYKIAPIAKSTEAITANGMA